ncbi:MAG: ribonucleotide reductase large subunit [Benniella sp.]|nr:MAG: ribonucleotide reductase large subunit [Benniella sp.]
MPAASTPQILGNNECFEPYTSNTCSRRVLAGEFQVMNPWRMLKDLVGLGLWNDSLKNRIIADNGVDSNILGFRVTWSCSTEPQGRSQKVIIDMAADRGTFIDQSQSLTNGKYELWQAEKCVIL